MNQTSSKKSSSKPFFSPGVLKFLHRFKEIFLQLLFPRVCPICGELLKLPKGWLSLLSSEESNSRTPKPLICTETSSKRMHQISAARKSLESKISPKTDSDPYNNISCCRSILICPNCYPALSLVEKPVCRKCSKPLVFDDEYYCENCQKGNLYFDQGKALWIHDDAARKVVYDLKFQNKRDNADLTGFEMALRMKELVVRWKAEVFIPVPLHKKRLRERGFNQAQLIAEKTSFWLEKLFGIMIPVDAGYLLRPENTKPQRILDVSARSQNVKDAFVVKKSAALQSGKADWSNTNGCEMQSAHHLTDSVANTYSSVILVDDIFTSGATLNACAKTLKAAGIQQVYFLTATVV